MSLEEYKQLKKILENRPTSYLKVKLDICRERKLVASHEIDMIHMIISRREKDISEEKRILEEYGPTSVHDIKGWKKT